MAVNKPKADLREKTRPTVETQELPEGGTLVAFHAEWVIPPQALREGGVARLREWLANVWYDANLALEAWRQEMA